MMAPRPDTGQPAEFVEAIFTCKGDFYDPEFPKELEQLNQRLHKLLNTGKDRLIVKKVEPWNSVKVTLNIPKDAAEKLKALASQNNGSELRSMGIMSLQMEGGKILSLTLASSSQPTASGIRGSGSELASPSRTSLSRSLSHSHPSSGANSSSSTSTLNNLLNLSSSSIPKPSDNKELLNALSLSSRESTLDAKPKASERRQRKVTANKSRSRSKKATAATTVTSASAEVTNESAVTTSNSSTSLTINSITDLVESAFNDQLKEEKDSIDTPKPDRLVSGQSSTSVDTARPTVIHPALRDTLHDNSHSTTTTVSVTGVTDKAAVNSLIASLFQHSLAADAACKTGSAQTTTEEANQKTKADLPQTSKESSPIDHKQFVALDEENDSKNMLKPSSHTEEHTETVPESSVQVPNTSIPSPVTSQSQTPQLLDGEEAMETTDTSPPKSPSTEPSNLITSEEISVQPSVEQVDELMDTSTPPDNDSTSSDQTPHPAPDTLSAIRNPATDAKSPGRIEQEPEISCDQTESPDADQERRIPDLEEGTESKDLPEDEIQEESVENLPVEPVVSMDVEEMKAEEPTSMSSFSPRLSQDSQDSTNMLSKKEVMIAEAVGSPSSSILKSPSLADEDTSSQLIENPEADLSNSTNTGAIFAKMPSTDLTDNTESLPLTEETEDEVISPEQKDLVDTTAAVTVLETDSQSHEVEEEEEEKKAATAVSSSQNPASPSTGEPTASTATTSAAPEPTGSPANSHQVSSPLETQSEPRELELLAPYRPDTSLYNLDMVSAELPDEILEDDYLSDSPPEKQSTEIEHSAFVDDSKTIAAPVSVIKSPVTVQSETLASVAETHETIPASVTTSVTAGAQPENLDQTVDNKHEQDGSNDYLKEEQFLVMSETEHELDTTSTVTKTTALVHHHQHTIQHILSEHEPAENGSSTSTDSGVVPGSPKSDICATPPSVDESHVHVKADIIANKDYIESSEVGLEDKPLAQSNGQEVKAESTLTSTTSASSLINCTTTTIASATSSVVVSVSENRPCVSILKTVRPAHTSVISDTNQAPKYVTTKVLQSDQKLRQHITQYQPAVVSAESKKESRSLLVSDVFLAAANAAQQHKSVVLQTMGPSGDLLNIVQQPVLLAKSNQTGNPPTYLLHGKEILYVDKRVSLHSNESLHTQTYVATQGTDASSTKPAYIISRDKTSNHIAANSPKQQTALSIKPHIIQQQTKSKTPTHVIQTKEGHSYGHYIVTTNNTPNAVTRVVARDDSPLSNRVSNVSALPTNLPPVTIINSHTVKANVRSLQNKPIDTLTLKPNTFDANNSTQLVQTLSNSAVKDEPKSSVTSESQPEPTLQTTTTVTLNTTTASDDKLAVQPVEEVVHTVDNGVPDERITNGDLTEHDDAIDNNKEQESNDKHKLEVEIEKDVGDNPPLISPNSQRKSGRTRKSPELEHPVVQQLSTPKVRKRGARQMSEDSNQSESKEDSQPATPTNKRSKSQHKASENTTPISQTNGPTRPKRATRSSGVQDLQSLPTVYRDRGKRTKR